MLEKHGIEYRYRDYTQDPLSAAEIRDVLKLLQVTPLKVLRRNDKMFRELGLSGEESDKELIELMARHPTLLQRPIAVFEGRAALGRPAENLLSLVSHQGRETPGEV